MRFGVILEPEESSSVLAEVLGFGIHRQIHAQGVQQIGDSLQQFFIEWDAIAKEWFCLMEDGTTYDFRDGVGTFSSDRPVAWQFEKGYGPVQLLLPGALPYWGHESNRRGGFVPVSVQHLGQRSWLLTFEHEKDPALRKTMVLNTETGVVEKIVGFNTWIAFTHVSFGDPVTRRLDRPFSPLEGPLPTDY